MTKAQAIKRAKQLEKLNDREYAVLRDDNYSRHDNKYVVCTLQGYWNDPTADERDVVYITGEDQYE